MQLVDDDTVIICPSTDQVGSAFSDALQALSSGVSAATSVFAGSSYDTPVVVVDGVAASITGVGSGGSSGGSGGGSGGEDAHRYVYDDDVYDENEYDEETDDELLRQAIAASLVDVVQQATGSRNSHT